MLRLRLPLLCLLLCAAAACQRAPSLTYQIAIPPDQPDHLDVVLEIRGAGGDGMILRGYAAKEVLRVVDFEAAGADGEAIPSEAGLDPVAAGRSTVDVPRFALHGALPSSIRVRYRVRPGNREGDSHVGFTGRSYGYAGKEFVFVTGRNLFLVPQPAEKIHDIEVRFSLPGDWEAVAPWGREGESWRPGIESKLAAEHLVTAAIGFGRFRESDFDMNGTRFRLAFESSLSDSEQRQSFERLEAAARTVGSLFGRGLGPEYLTVVVPKAPTGDEIAGEGWSTGQGGSLAPATGNRLKGFSERLIEAFVRYAPYRTEITRAEEFWLVDGIKNRYSWMAVADAGLVAREEIARELSGDFLTTLGVHGIELDLEKLYSAEGSQRSAREVLAPFTLLLLERELRANTKGSVTLESLLPRMFKGRKAESLWSLLPAVRPGFWDDFRRRHVKGKEMAAARQFYSLEPAKPSPDPPAGPAVRTLTLAYTGDTEGYLENCGCKTNQSGGVARRATALERIRKRDPQTLVLDAGSSFLRPKSQAPLDFLTLQEQGLYLRAVDRMRYQAAAIGTTELTFGLDHFRNHTRGITTPYLAANIRSQGQLIAPASVRADRPGLRVGIIGVFEPPRGRDATPLFEEHTLPLEVEDPVETLSREVPRMARQADLVIVMGRLTPFTIRRIAQTIPDLDVILSSEYSAPTQAEGHAQGELHKEDPEGFVGRTLVLYTHLTNYGLGAVKLGVDSEGRIAAADFSDLWLDEKVPDQPVVRDMLNRFYDQVGRQAAAQESVPPLFADDPARLTGRYVGGSVCAGCHETEYAQWITTSHASAFKTLLDRHRHFQPKCVSCHVVGYGTPHGYRLGAPEQTLANVQCEVCHGPGAEHAGAPSPVNIRREVPEKICLECHNPEHSDHFVYAERLPKVRHDFFEEGFGPPPAQAHEEHPGSAGKIGGGGR